MYKPICLNFGIIGSIDDLFLHGVHRLQFDSPSEQASWKLSLQEAIAEGLGEDSVLEEVYEMHCNRYCADCGAPDPHWASVNLGMLYIFVNSCTSSFSLMLG